MKMIEALEWAADYAYRSKLFEPPVKSNGYVVDGWKGVTPSEKAAIIKELAETVFYSEVDDEKTETEG